MEPIKWTTEKRRAGGLVPWDRNPRTMTQKQAEQLEESLQRFGLADPIIINTDNTIIGGHMRDRILLLMEEYGPNAEVDVRVPDRELTEDEVAELNVRLNKSGGTWDMDALANEFDLNDLMDWGFEDWELGMGEDIGDAEDEDVTTDDPGPSSDEARQTLAERFIVPPFSVLDARQGYWQTRKRAWVALGIRSELGRGMDLVRQSATVNDEDFYRQKTAKEKELGRELTTEEFLRDYHVMPKRLKIRGKDPARTFGQDLMRGENPKYA